MIMQKIKLLTLSLLLLPCIVLGIDYKPWYPTLGEVQAKADYLFQYYRKVDGSHGGVHRVSYDSFLNASAGVSVLNYYVEADLLLAHTRHQHFDVDSYLLEGRYQLMNDVTAEDCYSVIVGATLGKTTQTALHDFSSFHHARFESELHVSIGKEFSFKEYWLSRWWGVFCLGLGDSGSPWLRFNLNWEQNCWERHKWGLFMNTLYGLGGENISKYKKFEGYGPIAHRSIDLGSSYSYLFEFCNTNAEISLSYAFRVYAKNFPEYANLFTISILYPFGTGI